MKKAFIFDMDGVIIDTEPIHAMVKQSICEKYGIHLPREIFATFVGRTTAECFAEILSDYPDVKVSAKQMAKEKHDEYIRLIESDYEIIPIPGLPELLQRIQAAGYEIGLASSSAMRMINLALTKLGIKDYFKVIVSGAELPRSKPDPAVYLLAAEKLGVDPKNCTVVEDATAGITAAKAANMYCIAYHNPNSGNQDLSKADRIVESHDEILP